MTHADGGVKRYKLVMVQGQLCVERDGYLCDPPTGIDLVPASDAALLEQQVEQLDKTHEGVVSGYLMRITVLKHRAEQAEARVRELEDKQ